MRDIRMPYWNPNHFTLVVPKSSGRGRTSWPEQRLKWLELKSHFEEVAAIDQSEIIIDDAEVPDKNLSFDAHCQTSRTPMSDNTQKPAAAKSASNAIGVQKSLTKEHDSVTKSAHDTKENVPLDQTSQSVKVATNKAMSEQSNDNSNCPQDVKMKLLDYAKSALGISGNCEIKTFVPRAVDDYNEFSKFAYFASSTTVQPPTKKGWDKYHTIRRVGEIMVRRRACKGQKNVNNQGDSCTAKVLYICKAGVCGTLIVPIGTHASTCLDAGHSRSISHHGLDGILGYIGHTRPDITHASEADILEKADGNEVYSLKTDHFPVNQAPRSRHWGKLNRFNTTTLNYCDIKQRRCKELGCPAVIRYIRPNKTNIVLVQHIGIHNCSPSPLYGQINLTDNNEKIINDIAFNKDATDDLQKRQSQMDDDEQTSSDIAVNKDITKSPQKRKAQIPVDLIFEGSTSKRRQLSDLSSTSEKIIAPQNKKRVRFRDSEDLIIYANDSCVEPKRRKIDTKHLTSANGELLQDHTNTSEEQSSQLPIESSNGCYGSDIDALEIVAMANPLLSTSLEKEVQLKQEDVDVVFQLDGNREWRGTGLSEKKIVDNNLCNWGHKVCSSRKEKNI